MKPNFNQVIRLNNSGLGCLVTLVTLGLLLSAIGLQWVVNSFLIFVALLFLLPVVGIGVFPWWLKRNIIESNCPVCNYTFTAFNHTACQCPNCGESLTVEGNKFIRQTPDGTIEVEAIDISHEE